MEYRYRFDQRVVIVTGAGKGLGRAYAIELAARGARVLVNNRTHPGEATHSADATVAAIRAAGGEAIANHANVEDAAAPQQMVEQALDGWGRIDSVIFNAAIAHSDFFTRMSAAVFEHTMQINFNAPVALTRAVLPQLRRAGYGRLLYVTSAAGLYGNRGQSAYSASKAALIAFMQSVRLEECGYDFRVNAIAPFAETRMTAAHLPPHAVGAFDPRCPAALAAWLVHQECSTSGDVLLAGGRQFRNACTQEGRGFCFGETDDVTVENVAQHFYSIRAMDEPVTQNSADACFQRFLIQARSK